MKKIKTIKKYHYTHILEWIKLRIKGVGKGVKHWDEFSLLLVRIWNFITFIKVGDTDRCYNIETWGHCAKWSKPNAKRQILHDSTYVWGIWNSQTHRDIK